MPRLSQHHLLLSKLHSLNLPQGWCTYILVCQDGSYYTGATENLTARILNHAEGKGGTHTKSPDSLRLVRTPSQRRVRKATRTSIKRLVPPKEKLASPRGFPAILFRLASESSPRLIHLLSF